VEVVELDMSCGFTAARARNAGFARLMEVAPSLSYVQSVDGDCELSEGWLETARQYLQEHPDFAVVCGRRRERFPRASVYNLLCDIEWDTPVGPTRACGGDAMMRVAQVREAGGYNARVIAAEDDEICVRIRKAGWKCARLDAEMTRHDAAMFRFRQWWKRAVRAGHGFAQGVAMHGAPPERHFVKQLASCFTWGAVLPSIAILAAWPTRGISLVVLALLYAALVAKVWVRFRRLGAYASAAYAVNCWLAKFAGVVGALTYYKRRLFRGPAQIIEYK
jgi:GT2 family glycosyltransferase